MATKLVLVVILGPETLFFGDETLSRRRFWVENSFFWRRHPLSSSFLRRKLLFLATTPLIVVFFVRKTHFFGDKTLSRRRFVPETSTFWRRDPFSSSLLDGEPTFLATKPLLVVFFAPETLFFGDDTRPRRLFCAEISTFWRRHSFSSPFWDRKRYFLATTLILVAFFAPEPPLFGDDTLSRRRFWTENPLFWRRHPFSSSFWDRKRYFLATTPLIVVVFVRK
ncbi:hypothetical protein [Caldibacillus thermoamylovorans]|uniref:hypothetical protein n=1 Tax=Caldibacillus thermoamylovorans TaxID=35841 RepID=UPI0012600DC7|nr:hypothetical protein [Caldibacillus thermoamylovorans]